MNQITILIRFQPPFSSGGFGVDISHLSLFMCLKCMSLKAFSLEQLPHIMVWIWVVHCWDLVNVNINLHPIGQDVMKIIQYIIGPMVALHHPRRLKTREDKIIVRDVVQYCQCCKRRNFVKRVLT